MDTAILVLSFDIAVILVTVATLGLVFLSLSVSAAGSPNQRLQQSGSLMAVALTQNELVLEVGTDQEPWLFSVAPDTKLLLNEEPVRLEDFRPGDFLEIIYTQQDHRYLALEVAARGGPVTLARVRRL